MNLNAMHVSLQDLIIAAETVYGEARGEIPQGRIAVAWSIRNRYEKPCWWSENVEGYQDHSVAAVCRKKSQYSCWNPGDPNVDKIARASLEDFDFQQCFYAVLAVFLGYEADPTDGSTHYFKVGTLTPKWATDDKFVCTIGTQRFYHGID